MKFKRVFSFARNTMRDAVFLGPTAPLRELSLGRARYTLEIPGFGDIVVRKGTSDLEVVRQVFADRQYDLERFAQWTRIDAARSAIVARGRRPMIIDAGANNGASARWFATMLPDALVVALEPDHENAELCRENTATCRNVLVREHAIGGSPGTVALHNPEGKAWSVRTVRQERGVRVVTVDEILQEHPDCELLLLKADIEGFEADLFEANAGWLDSVTVVIVEPHDWMLPGRFTSTSLQRETAARRFELLLSGENLIYVR
jgi:FkbM family methyltransferase